MGISFRHSAGFGKRMEYNLVGKMLMEGLDVYLPLVDDHGVDCVIKKEDGTFIEVQIKARSNEVTEGDAALFAAITHELTENFFFVFFVALNGFYEIWYKISAIFKLNGNIRPCLINTFVNFY